MQFDVFTLFPELFPPYLDASILGRARQAGLLDVKLHNIRDYATDKHQVTDDAPFGGGGGMVMKPEPIFAAVEATLGSLPSAPVILLSPQGRPFTQSIAQELAKHERIGLICGRYEGVDERVRQYLATDEISIGDYVLTGGELPALILIDAVARNIPGALGDPEGHMTDSHASGLLEYPHYTRPQEFRGWPVPEILLSGDHARIERWRRQQTLLRTADRRPDLFVKAELSAEDKKIWEETMEIEIYTINLPKKDRQAVERFLSTESQSWTGTERWKERFALEDFLAQWASFIADIVENVYDQTIYDYQNSLYTRTTLFEISSFLSDVGRNRLNRLLEPLDNKFKEVTRFSKTTVLGDIEFWWFHRVPLHPLEEMQKDLKERGLPD